MRILPATAALLALALALPGCGEEKKTIVKEAAGTPAPSGQPAGAPGIAAPPTKTVAPPGVTGPSPPAVAAPNATTVTLEIAGLHCERDCVPRVEAMLQRAAGVESVQVDYAAKQAVVRVRPGTDAADVAAAVSGGFVAAVR